MCITRISGATLPRLLFVRVLHQGEVRGVPEIRVIRGGIRKQSAERQETARDTCAQIAILTP